MRGSDQSSRVALQLVSLKTPVAAQLGCFFRCIVCVTLTANAARAGLVEDWNAAVVDAVRKEAPPPCLVTHHLPLLHLSIHRAVDEAVKAGLTEAEQAQAANHAGDEVFRLIFPSQGKLADEVRDKNAQGAANSTATALSDAAVQRTFQEHENDGSTTTIHYVPSNKPGQWQRTPPNFRPPELPHWGEMKPFLLDDVMKFRASPPPALDSKAYADDLNEVKELGAKNSTKRTAEQTLIAKFWADFSYTTSPAGHWNDIARQMSLQRKLSLAESARLFALLNVTLADTCIVIWNTKYHYNFWRPVTAIRRADEDNNEATISDKNWEPLLVTPPHPEYVSGHSGISGAAAFVLAKTFGTKVIHFDVESDDVKDVKRSFTSFQTCAEEVSRSRVLGGIHFPSACKHGLALGREVAKQIDQRWTP